MDVPLLTDESDLRLVARCLRGVAVPSSYQASPFNWSLEPHVKDDKHPKSDQGLSPV